MPSLRLREMVKHYRLSKGLSYRELGTLTGIDFSAIWRFEEGKPLAEEQWAALVCWFFGLGDAEKEVGRRGKRKEAVEK